VRWLVLLGIAGWFVVGQPMTNIANIFWAENPAPWGAVDAYYYPNRHDLTVHESRMGLDRLEQCRTWVEMRARAKGDANISIGDYECGIGKIDDFYGLTVYRKTVR